jgi:hypothetical protein
MEYPTSGWVNFQSATLGQFCIGGNTAPISRGGSGQSGMTAVVVVEDLVALELPLKIAAVPK